MRCPSCEGDDDKVIDSRPAEDGQAIRRRRVCAHCATRFTTYERVEAAALYVRKRSGTVSVFRREKVLDGMLRAANGRIPVERLELAAIDVERSVRTLGTAEVTTEEVGIAVLQELRDLDTVTYMRFASVYKDFQQPEDFERELSSLRKAAPPKGV
ncbi:MAG: transcriptional repressor NrdR [Glaciecola sp.]|jgi:transcriptional repressor NrdR